jgi:hypothetical protein
MMLRQRGRQRKTKNKTKQKTKTLVSLFVFLDCPSFQQGNRVGKGTVLDGPVWNFAHALSQRSACVTFDVQHALNPAGTCQKGSENKNTCERS